MPSPFPGMDPFLEGYEWEDFHAKYVVEVAAALVPRLRPRYVVRNERRIYVEHPSSAGTITPVLVTLPMPEERREVLLTIREHGSMEVVTVIEVLSPANKESGGDGRREYLKKREEILQSETNLVEIDLLRGGQPLPTLAPLPPGDHYTLVCRARRRSKAEVYAWTLYDRLPEIAVPLARGDADTTIDLQTIFTDTYDRAGYDSLDYKRELSPPLPQATAEWAKQRLSQVWPVRKKCPIAQRTS